MSRVAEVAARLHGPPVLVRVAAPFDNDTDRTEQPLYFPEPDDPENPYHVATIFYWYRQGSYDGTGEALLLRGGDQWADMSLGHCSCYGPWESLPSDGAFVSSLGALIAKWSAERKAEMTPLVAAARAWLL